MPALRSVVPVIAASEYVEFTLPALVTIAGLAALLWALIEL